MEILIQGSKGGYKIFHKTANFPSNFAADSRREDVENNRLTVGKTTYSISMAGNGCIFSKSVGIWDVKRGSIGTVSFSVFIPSSKRLTGTDIKSLLDEISNVYSRNYIVNGDLNLEIREDWMQITAITNAYESRMTSIPSEDIENFASGTKDAAFIYYSQEQELLNYLQAPYQEEYSLYKQVLLIDRQFEGKPENPLNALQHDLNANLTSKISLDNPKYKLRYNPHPVNGIRIEVTVQGSKRENNSQVKQKDTLEITWSKTYYKSERKSGKAHELSPYLTVNEQDKSFNIKDEITLEKLTHTITCETKLKDQSQVRDAKIYYQVGNNQPVLVTDNRFTLSAEELDKLDCYVYAVRPNNMASIKKKLNKEDIHTKIVLYLARSRKVRLDIKNDRGITITNYSLTLRGKSIQPQNGEIELLGDEILQPWDLNFVHEDYYEHAVKRDYLFGEETILTIILAAGQINQHAKNQQGSKKYVIKIDPQKGVDSTRINNTTVSLKPTVRVESKYGYSFEKWEQKPNKDPNLAGTYEAVFREHWYRKIPELTWYISALAIVAIIIAVIYIDPSANDVGGDNPPPGGPAGPPEQDSLLIEQEKIRVLTYVKGIELQKDSLAIYEKKYCGASATEDTLCKEIKNALAIRKAVSKGDISDLRTRLKSEDQKVLKKALQNIKTRTEENKAKDFLTKNNSMLLGELAEKINEITKKREAKAGDQKQGDESKPVVVKNNPETRPQETSSTSIKDKEFERLVIRAQDIGAFNNFTLPQNSKYKGVLKMLKKQANWDNIKKKDADERKDWLQEQIKK